ncbi:MAG TPA: DinB family protein [Lacibacter sp.]|nr:DinB family protein [Lacibacter sp.]HMO90148.1 DinB family protein [Lacibacter sp.]HMP85843.1 DinB family protein [Lacibacter sp.]
MQQAILLNCSQHLTTYTQRVQACLQLLTNGQVWHQPNAATNSIANLVLHLCGNLTQYVLSGLGGMPDERQRDQEFSTRDGRSKEELFQQLQAVVEEVKTVIGMQDEAALLRTYRVQGFEKTGLAIVLHITEHYAYHTGQIALLTKLLTNRDLGFYQGLDLNRRNG